MSMARMAPRRRRRDTRHLGIACYLSIAILFLSSTSQELDILVEAPTDRISKRIASVSMHVCENELPRLFEVVRFVAFDQSSDRVRHVWIAYEDFALNSELVPFFVVERPI